MNLPEISKKKKSEAWSENTKGGGGGAKVKASQLLQMADLLWKLGEEQKRQQDDLVPDERVKSFCDELLDIVDTCATESGRNVKLRKDLNAAEENYRLRRELSERDGKVVALENTFLMYVTEREKGKQRSNFFREFALKSRFELHDTTCAALVFSAWQTAIAKQHYEQETAAISLKLRMDGFSAKAETMMRGLGQKGAAAVAMCFNRWGGAMRASIMRKRALGSLTRQLEIHDFAVINHFASFWFILGKWQKEERVSKVTMEEADEKLEALATQKKLIVERFGQQAMANMQRKINGNSSQIIADGFANWVSVTKETKSERILEEEREKAAMEHLQITLKAKKEKLEAIEGALRGSGANLQRDIYALWSQVAKDEIMQRKLKDKAMNSTLRSISGSELQLKDAVASAWLKEAIDGRMRRALEEANNRYMELKVKTQSDKLKAATMGFGKQDRDLKAKMIEDWHKAIALRKQDDETKQERFAKAGRMIANSTELLLRSVWEVLGKTIRERQNKGKNMEKALRILGASEMALKKEVFQVWYTDITENRNIRRLEAQEERAAEMAERSRAQKMQAIDKAFGDGLVAQASQCFDRWSEETKAQIVRKKRSNSSMATALRAIDKATAGLSAEVFVGWQKVVREEALLLRLGSAEQQAAMIQTARTRAIAMFEKMMNGNAIQLIYHCFMGWIDENAAEKKRELRREIITARVMRNVEGGEEVVKAMIMSTWLQLTETNRDLGIERRRLKRMTDIGREVVLRLRARNLLKLAFVWWYMKSC